MINQKQHIYRTVLAEISQVTDLGTHIYYEVVQMTVATKAFESYNSSNTFEDGEVVIRYVPITELEKGRFINWRKND